jgi:hypothetical protein
MAIKSDEFDHDMSGWVQEKSFNVLRRACGLADWLHKEDCPLPASEAERVSELVELTIYDAANLYKFGCENTKAPLKIWTDLLFSHGRVRLKEFSDVVSGKIPSDASPAEYPASVQEVLEELAAVRSAVGEENASITMARQKVTELGESLKDSRIAVLSDAGNKLLDLVDQQTYYATISWQSFVPECQRLIDETRQRYLDKMKRYRWDPNEEGGGSKNIEEK